MSQDECPKCGGSGWVVVERGGVSGVERCACLSGQRARQNEERAGIPPLYRKASLDNFKLPEDNPTAHRSLASVLVTVKAFAREFPSDKRPGLLFIGEPGTGKTHLAVAALRLAINRGFEGVFFDYQNLFDRIRAGYDPASGVTDKEAYQVALDCDVLLLDDLGARRVSDWVEDIVAAIITHRCNHKKPLIATTNLPDPEVGDVIVERDTGLPQKVFARTTLAERVGERARSRLFEMCRIVRMPLVEDFRLRKIVKSS